MLEGRGRWFLNGEEMPLKAGDFRYSKLWDLHGIRNSGDEPMRCFVFKWANKGVPEPVKAAAAEAAATR